MFQAHVAGGPSPKMGQIVLFNSETLDIGDGFNPYSGVYTVPQAGTYTFTWSIRIYNKDYYDTELVVNYDVKDYMRTSTYTENGSYTYYASATATTSVQVTTGDRVFIRVRAVVGTPFILSDQSTFSGWLLH